MLQSQQAEGKSRLEASEEPSIGEEANRQGRRLPHATNCNAGDKARLGPFIKVPLPQGAMDF